MTKKQKEDRMVFRVNSEQKELFLKLADELDITYTKLLRSILFGETDIMSKIISFIVKRVKEFKSAIPLRFLLEEYTSILHPFYIKWIETELVHSINTGFEVRLTYINKNGLIYFHELCNELE